jgi:hypothetical protein
MLALAPSKPLSTAKRRDPASPVTPSAPTLELAWNQVTSRTGRTQLVCRWLPLAA